MPVVDEPFSSILEFLVERFSHGIHQFISVIGRAKPFRPFAQARGKAKRKAVKASPELWREFYPRERPPWPRFSLKSGTFRKSSRDFCRECDHFDF